MKKLYLILLLVAVIALAGCKTEQPIPVEPDGGIGDTPIPVEPDGGIGNTPMDYTVRITDDGFVPSELTVKSGDTVTWINEMDKGSWPASAQHPTHTVYPGSDIEKCKSASPIAIFDACRELQPGESWSFVFLEQGEWGYHDHVNFPGNYGKVIVE